MNKKYFILSLVVLFFILSSCNPRGADYRPDPKRAEFFQGTEGIRMWMDPGVPPPRVYFYSDVPSNEYNAINVEVNIHNVGSSWVTGALYVSGYDPGMIFFEDINIPRTKGGFFDHCRIRFDIRPDIVSSLGGFLNCNLGDKGFEYGKSAGSSGLADYWGIDNLGKWLDAAADKLGWKRGKGLETVIDWTENIDIFWNGNDETWTLDLNLGGLDIEARRYGGELVAMMSALRLDRFNGKAFTLRPDNHLFPGGESTIVSFPGYIDKDAWPEGLDSTDVTFVVTACYAYVTFATPLVCIDANPFSENEKVCTPRVTDMKGSRGAPVAITNILQENTYRSAIFTIYIQNVGRGKVIYPGSLELCSPYYPGILGPQHEDMIIVGDVRIGDQFLECYPNDYMLKLTDGRGQITCTYEFEYATTKTAYTTPLSIELWYGYMESERRYVHIKRVR